MEIPLTEKDLLEIHQDVSCVAEDFESVMDTVILAWQRDYSSLDKNAFRRKSCLAHLLQLGINDAIKHPEVASTLKKVNTIVAWFFKSYKWYNVLRGYCSGKGLVKPCDTRLNFQFFCIERLLQEVRDGPAEEQKVTFVNVCGATHIPKVNKMLDFLLGNGCKQSKCSPCRCPQRGEKE